MFIEGIDTVAEGHHRAIQQDGGRVVAKIQPAVGARRDEVDVLQSGGVVAGEQQVGDLVGGFLDVAVQGAAPYVQSGGGVIHPLPGGAGDVSAEPGGKQERAPGVLLQVRGARQ